MLTQKSSSHPLLSYADRVAAGWQDFLLLCARILIGWIFVMYGWGKVMNVPAFIKSSLGGVPFSNVIGYIAAPLELVGGVLILLGLATRYAAIAILLFTVAATLVGHRYWEFTGAQFRGQRVHFWKNISMLGGLVLLFVAGAGRWSVDRFLARNR